MLMLVPAMALAQLTDGKVYNIVNVAHPSSSMAPAAASQMSIEEKRQYADVIINNDGTLEETEQTVQARWNETKQMLNNV